MTKKSFSSGISSAAAAFISEAEKPVPAADDLSQADVQAAPAETRAAKHTRPAPRETRSKRIPVLMTPSLYTTIADMAEYNYISVNEMINQILDEAAAKFKSEIESED